MTDIPRRTFLKGAAAVAAALSVGGWRPHLDGMLADDTTLPFIDSVPLVDGEPFEEVQLMRGLIMKVNASELDTEALIDEAMDRIARVFERAPKNGDHDHGYRPVRPLDDVEYFVVPAGGDHLDPLAHATTVGGRQLWLMEKV